MFFCYGLTKFSTLTHK